MQALHGVGQPRLNERLVQVIDRAQLEKDLAEDTRFNLGTASVDFTVANGAPPLRPILAPGMATPDLRPY